MFTFQPFAPGREEWGDPTGGGGWGASEGVRSAGTQKPRWRMLDGLNVEARGEGSADSGSGWEVGTQQARH